MFLDEYKKTCSIDAPIVNGLTFAKSPQWVTKAVLTEIPLGVLCPVDSVIPQGGLCSFFPVVNPFLEFVRCHNDIYKGEMRVSNKIDVSSDIYLNAHIGNSGMRYVKDEGGRVLLMKHMGNVVIGKNVRVGPFSSIARGTLKQNSTVIGDDSQIGSNCSVGHNVVIGERTLIIDGTIIAGSAKIGDDCYIGLGSKIRGHISIANNTMIAMGAVVVSSITESGFIYAGVPARKMKPWDGGW